MKKILITLISVLSYVSCSSFYDGIDDIIIHKKISDNAPGKEVDPANATINLAPTGDRIFWGFDIKYHNRAKELTQQKAEQIFIEDDLEMLRISILPLEHNQDGSVMSPAPTYTEAMKAIKIALDVRPNVKIFAGLKLNGADTFHEWAREAGSTSVKVEEYAKILAGFLAYMKGNDVPIHILGIDNEKQYNLAEITPSKYVAILNALTQHCTEMGLTMPHDIIGAEDYGPYAEWVDGFIALNRADLATIFGTHYYPKSRPLDKLKKFTTSVKSANTSTPLWNSEVHWDKRSDEQVAKGETMLYEFARCYIATFDCFDLGFTGMVWWDYQRETTHQRGSAMKALTVSTQGYKTALVTDHDGNSLNLTSINNRIFVSGKKASLWITNMTLRDYNDYIYELPEGTVIRSAKFTTWANNWDKGDGITTGVVNADKNRLTLSILSKTITLIEFETE